MNQRMIQSNRPSEAAEQPTMTPDSEERFRALVEHSCDALALFDTNGTIMYVNPSSTRVLGYAGGEVVGRNTFEIVHPEDRQSMRDFFAELVRKPGGVASAQFRVFRPDGSSQWLEGTGNNLLAESGVGAIVVNFRDITERRLAEQMLRAHAQQQMVVAEFEHRFTTPSHGVGRDVQGSASHFNTWGRGSPACLHMRVQYGDALAHR